MSLSDDEITSILDAFDVDDDTVNTLAWLADVSTKETRAQTLRAIAAQNNIEVEDLLYGWFEDELVFDENTWKDLTK